MTERNSGSCQCGAVRFQVDGAFDRFLLCHCARCRKDTGSAHASNLFASTATLTWPQGESGVTKFVVPGTRHTRAFCSNCGSAVPYTLAIGIVVPAGSLDTVPVLAPQAHIFMADRAAWDEQLHALPEFEALPR